ncbi:hypothetical protein ACQZ4Y_19255 [Rhizobium sp. L80/93]|uniref:hypothetical protein n=1 Tax=Rhizobium sp. E27B/91 TaxID=2819995 RepID=UPI001ADCBC7C|nr:hypothetical protein [Rhizobium sp. E27B/91]MBO9186433.1 hypothetical protein [Rhizobium sp. E27B/91]
MTDDQNARDAVEDSGHGKARAADSPAAGPHAKKELTDNSKTPGAGAFPTDDEESVEPGAG